MRSIPLVLATLVSFACFAGRAQAVPRASHPAPEQGYRLHLQSTDEIRLGIADPFGAQPAELALEASWHDGSRRQGHVGIAIVISILFVAAVALSLFLLLNTVKRTDAGA